MFLRELASKWSRMPDPDWDRNGQFLNCLENHIPSGVFFRLYLYLAKESSNKAILVAIKGLGKKPYLPVPTPNTALFHREGPNVLDQAPNRRRMNGGGRETV